MGPVSCDPDRENDVAGRAVVTIVLIVGMLAVLAGPLAAEEQGTFLAAVEQAAVDADQAPAKTAQTAAPSKPAPLPLHTIEGVGGVLITPTAYLVNPGPEGTKIGLPTASFSAVFMGQKNLQTFAVTETFLRRIEVGYAISRFHLGTLGDELKKATSRDIRDEVYLHHFNLRGLLIEENSCGLPLPALTAGVHFKVNSGIESIDDELNGALDSIGYERSSGVDYTLTASKTLPNILGRPMIVSAGLRNSSASDIGYLGFSDHCQTTVEANAVYLLTDWMAVAYEFRQKNGPYQKLDGLVGEEDNWHTIALGFIINENLTVSAAYGHFGRMFNSREDCGWGFQLKYEF